MFLRDKYIRLLTIRIIIDISILGHITVQRHHNKTPRRDVFGCGIDNISNIIVFTRNGECLDRPFYFNNCIRVNGCKKVLQPTVQVIPKCEEGRDLQLPSLTLSFNFGQVPFQYKRSLEELFEIIIPENQVVLPPKISNECPLIQLNE